MEWKLEENKRAIAILRVSSHRQKDNMSHALQEAEIQEYCKRNKLKLVQVNKIVESAKNSEQRKQYVAALNWALENGCYHVLWYMHDRESRNLQDVERNEQLVKENKICLHYVRDGRVLHKSSPDGDFFLRDILAASNKQFVRTLSAKVSDAMRKKAEDGWLPSNHVPLGYCHQKIKDEYCLYMSFIVSDNLEDRKRVSLGRRVCRPSSLGTQWKILLGTWAFRKKRSIAG